MIYRQAEEILAETLAPLTTGEFFGAVGKRSLDLRGGPAHPRGKLFGDDPKRTLLNAFRTHATTLESHARAPTQAAPEPRAVSSANEMLELVKDFHARGYTVRVPHVTSLAPGVRQFTRALEFMLRRPAKAAMVWGAAGAEAIIHYDKPDNIIVQLEGRKRWFISTDPPGLQNKWTQVGEPLPDLTRHRIVDVEPGDLIYVPHGTPHTVESTTESLHLAIVFEPLSLKDAIIAAVDRLADSDRTFRETAMTRVQDADLGHVSSQVLEGLERLMAHCRSEDFLKEAIDLRASRSTAEMAALPKPSAMVGVTPDTRVRQSPLAICYLRPSFDSLDFSQPGEHISIHRGVEPELQFIASTDSFRVGDVPGASSVDVKAALVSRLIQSGFLEIAD